MDTQVPNFEKNWHPSKFYYSIIILSLLLEYGPNFGNTWLLTIFHASLIEL